MSFECICSHDCEVPGGFTSTNIETPPPRLAARLAAVPPTCQDTTGHAVSTYKCFWLREQNILLWVSLYACTQPKLTPTPVYITTLDSYYILGLQAKDETRGSWSHKKHKNKA